ncbi:phosphoadenosine phosphosulfate reductase family protein [Chryseobacterium sp. SN22]|uniref:phosphoadenosine phosphosulfate reductase domain-containing protein n=1 Tax=Chryseobacterium sp. SN22 TaxID=2606431 RepID=UPI0011ED2A8C|nr:phosphoadenosine phosphosulfate reductase family protein [Chryseobacterium sp. SN22]KAA0126467.1 phosphoadenosine phosphosulfate reductase family protein [Chryseobacterium sp. SN22]
MDLAATLNCIKTLSAKVDRVILFHSGAGKDSICLLNMLAPHFKEIVCVYMYMVKDLEHINRHINWAEKKYSNCRFIQTPHYAYYNNKKLGMYGTDSVKYAEWNVAKINDKIKAETGIEWAVMGFKKNDSLNRRLMLNTYPDEMTSDAGKKLYPLSNWNNKQVLAYIRKERLIEPINYGQANRRSSGTDIEDIAFLLWCRKNYPNDLKKVIAEFPDCQRILFEYDYQTKQ